ncbi:MAG: LysM domain-containing protein [Phycisphaerae bacterium]|jgi:nucleoid-associated protein YgaU
MRTEIKIGIAVGLIVAVGAVLYLVVFNHEGESGSLTGPSGQATALPSRHAGSSSSDPIVPIIGGAPAAPEVAAATPQPSSPATPEATTVTPVITPTIASAPPAPEPSASPSVLPVKVGAATTKPASPAAAPVAVVAPAGGSTYVVKKSDTGLWRVAEQVYGPGKGRYWTLIEKANPQVDTFHLSEGMTLVIPPVADKSAKGGEKVVAAGVQVPELSSVASPSDTSEHVYTVQAGDSWWSIATKEYKDGKYATNLRKANPHVEVLRTGQKIKLPAINGVKAAGTAATVTAPSAVKPAAKPAVARPAAPVNTDRPVFD